MDILGKKTHLLEVMTPNHQIMNNLSPTLPKFAFDNSFSRSLEGCFVECNAAPAEAPKLLQLNHALAEELGLDPVVLNTEAGTSIFSGNVAPDGAAPLAQAYAGHQFGGFSPQLGDGRALMQTLSNDRIRHGCRLAWTFSAKSHLLEVRTPEPQIMNNLSPTLPKFAFDNSFSRSLEGCFVECNAAPAEAPKLLQLNHALAEELGLDPVVLNTEAGTSIFSGNVAPDGAAPLAQAYAGHQFGGFSPQLGDGRALLLGEVIDVHGKRRDIQLKGSGRTPFSRGGDGKSALGPVLREYLIGEAMHALGVPTTRALAAVSTGETVQRETPLPGGILTRVAASHMRVGSLQFFAARGDEEKVRQLADYAIARHHPDAADAENPYLAFLEAVTEAQAALVAKWMSIGFIHGVMNTDNTTISGETIDYGPCAFMDSYAPDTVFSSIDTQGRYAYGNQPDILGWNLARLAETLIPLVDPDKDSAIEILTDVINTTPARYDAYWMAAMRRKIGLTTEHAADGELIGGLLTAMHQGGADFTLVFRHLATAVRGNAIPVQGQFAELSAINAWLENWRARLSGEDVEAEARAAAMDRINPIYIPRNQKVEEALTDAVEHEDMSPFEALLAAVSNPFDVIAGQENYAEPGAQTTLPYQTFCGT